MIQEPLALLGLLPLVPYLICLYISYRMPHVRSGGFWRWIVGWASFGLFTILFAITRVRTVLSELSGYVPFDSYRFGLVFAGSCCLLIFVLVLRWSFPNSDRTLLDDLRADAARLWSGIHRVWSWRSSCFIRQTRHEITRRNHE
jgi:hypothetical protein